MAAVCRTGGHSSGQSLVWILPGGGAFPATCIQHVLPAAWGAFSHDLSWAPEFLCTAVFQKWLDLMAWDFFTLLEEVLVPTIEFLPKEGPETLQTPLETLWLQLAQEGAAISYAEIDMQVVNSSENKRYISHINVIELIIFIARTVLFYFSWDRRLA